MIQENWDESVQTELHDRQDGNGNSHIKAVVWALELIPIIDGKLLAYLVLFEQSNFLPKQPGYNIISTH